MVNLNHTEEISESQFFLFFFFLLLIYKIEHNSK